MKHNGEDLPQTVPPCFAQRDTNEFRRWRALMAAKHGRLVRIQRVCPYDEDRYLREWSMVERQKIETRELREFMRVGAFLESDEFYVT